MCLAGGGGLTVGDRLVVGDEHHDVDAEVLQPDTVGERAEQMADVKQTGGAIAGEHAKAAGIAPQLSLELTASRLRSLKRSTHRRHREINLLEFRPPGGDTLYDDEDRPEAAR